MKRIAIIGSSGSGKSTLARQLGATLEIPVIHLDRHFWHPGWVGTPLDEWKQMVKEMTQRQQWIIDGNYRETLDIRLEAADTVVFLDLPRWLCTWRAIKRRIEYMNRTRPDMAEGCKEPLFDPHLLHFMRRIWDYPNRAWPQVTQELQQVAHHKRVIWLESTRDVNTFLADPKAFPVYSPPQKTSYSLSSSPGRYGRN